MATVYPDLAADVLERFQNSPREDHQHLCAAVGAMVQTLKDQGIPLTAVAYFGATVASLDRLSRDPAAAASSDHVISALLVFLSLLLRSLPTEVLRSRGSSVADSVVRILGFPSLTEGGVKAGLKCLAGLITAGDSSNWPAVSPYYGVILSFATDHRLRVRKQSHSCLQDILLSFQQLPVLVHASEGITTTFERFLLLAGGSKSANAASAEEVSSGATKVLYLLNALKDCLLLMAPKSTNIILRYFKSLLDLRQPILTKHILEILQSRCSVAAQSISQAFARPVSELNPEVLLDLLCSLGQSVSAEGKSADEMASIARLLHHGMEIVYNLNKQICVAKLPFVCNALGDILASGHEEAMLAALEALKGLIHTCIDETLVEQGINEMRARHQGKKSGPTIIEKICAVFEGFLDVHYNAVWDLAFNILSVAFDTLGESSRYLLAEAVTSLADMHSLPDEDFPYRKQLHECIGSAIAAMGPKEFFNLLSIETISDDNAWLFPILKQHIIGSRLSFFLREILDMIYGIEKNISKLVKEDKLFSAKRAEGYVYSLWSLLPSFCNYPCDTASSFDDLQNLLCDTLVKESNLHGIICYSLQTLVQQNKGISSEVEQKETCILSESEPEETVNEDVISKSEIRAKAFYTQDVAEENLKAIRAFSSKFFRVLYSVFWDDSKDSNEFLLSTVREFASISDKKVVRKFFIDTMKELLGATQEAVNAKQRDSSSSMQVDTPSNKRNIRRALLLDFAVSLLPGLGEKEIDLLFSAIRPAIQDEEGSIQKKAYKVLSIILKDFDQLIKRNLDVLIEMMVASLPFCQFPAKRYRLECLYYVIVYISKDSFEQRKRDIVSSFLTEILLALKEANKKTRNRAYDLLVEIGHACEDGNRDGGKENLLQLFNMVAGGLAGETPHMISAAVKGLARLTYEFSDLIGVAYNLLPSAFLLLQRNNREVAKANLGLIKVLVVKSRADKLQEHMRGMVEGLLKWENSTRNHFKAKVKLLIEMLVRKCGVDAVKTVMPEEHMKLLSNIRKIKERKERQAKSLDDAESLTAKTSISRQSRWNHTRIFSDFGDENDNSDNEVGMSKSFTSQRAGASSWAGSKAFSLRSKQKHRAAKSLSEELLDQSNSDPLDLLDQQTMRLALQSSSTHAKRKKASNDEPEIDSDGRLIVYADGKKPKREKIIAPDRELDAKSFAGSLASSSTRSNKRRKTSDSGWAYTGREYTSKKARGDMKKKDKMEPYAYWPLDRKLLNRRAEHKATARKGMARVVKFVKKFEGRSTSALSSLSVKNKKMKLKKKHNKSKNR